MLAVMASIVVGYFSGTLLVTSFDELRDDASAYNRQALMFLDARTFGAELGDFKKPPGYSLFLAVVQGLFGKHIPVAWIAQLVLFVAALYMLWRLSEKLLHGWMVFLPLVGTALYWGVTFYVFKTESELFALFLITLLIFVLFQEKGGNLSLEKMVLGAVVLALLILTKPIFLYSTPFFACFFVWDAWQKYRMRAAFHAAVFISIVALFAGGWMVRNYMVTGDYQVEQHTGHIVYGRGAIAELPWHAIGAYMIASVGGDFVADMFVPGYADSPVPSVSRGQIIAHMQTMRKNGVNEYDSNAYFFAGGIEKIQQNLFGYAITVIPGVMEMNAPVNHRGFSLAHMFAGTRDTVPRNVKIAILLAIRAGWLVFLSVVLYGATQAWRTRDRRWLLLIFLVAYVNGIYALVIAPVEPRFLVPILPLYFLFFTIGIRHLLTGVGKLYSVEHI